MNFIERDGVQYLRSLNLIKLFGYNLFYEEVLCEDPWLEVRSTRYDHWIFPNKPLLIKTLITEPHEAAQGVKLKGKAEYELIPKFRWRYFPAKTIWRIEGVIGSEDYTYNRILIRKDVGSDTLFYRNCGEDDYKIVDLRGPRK